jgi:hypothetical protein
MVGGAGQAIWQARTEGKLSDRDVSREGAAGGYQKLSRQIFWFHPTAAVNSTVCAGGKRSHATATSTADVRAVSFSPWHAEDGVKRESQGGTRMSSWCRRILTLMMGGAARICTCTRHRCTIWWRRKRRYKGSTAWRNADSGNRPLLPAFFFSSLIVFSASDRHLLPCRQI